MTLDDVFFLNRNCLKYRTGVGVCVHDCIVLIYIYIYLYSVYNIYIYTCILHEYTDTKTKITQKGPF